MPVKLGLTAAGDAASAFGGSGKAGPTSQAKTTSTNTSAGSQTGTSTPNLNPLLGGFQSSLVPALTGMFGAASTPIYGTAQVAQVANNGDAATNAASSALTQNLARRGVLNSGAEASGQTQLQQANEANTVNFENQLPLLNRQNEQQQQENVLGLAEGLTGKALTTNTSAGTTNNMSSGSNTVQASGPAFGASMLNSLGGGLSGLGGGKSSSLGGGKGSGEAPQINNSLGPALGGLGNNGDFGGET